MGHGRVLGETLSDHGLAKILIFFFFNCLWPDS